MFQKAVTAALSHITSCHWIVLPVETGLLYHTFKIKNGPECSQGSGW